MIVHMFISPETQSCICTYTGLRREDRVCKECGNGEVEDTDHFMMRCAYVVKERERLENLMSSRVEGWHELGEMKRY